MRWREAQRFYTTLSPPTCSQAPSSSFAPLPRARVALPRLAPATCQLPTTLGGRLSGCQDPAARCMRSAFQVSRSGSSFYTCTYDSTTVPAAYQSVYQPDNRFIILLYRPTGQLHGHLNWPKWVTAQQGLVYCLDEAQLVLVCSACHSALLHTAPVRVHDGNRKKAGSLVLVE